MSKPQLIDLQKLEVLINEFIDISGDDISSVINHGDCLEFSHVTLTEKNFSYEVTVTENGCIQLTKDVLKDRFENDPVASIDNAVDNDDGSALTLYERKVVKTGTVSNIQDVIAFIYSCAE